jgi:hypothetical protein
MDTEFFGLNDADRWIDIGLVMAIVLTAYLAIFWIALVLWTYRDIEARTANTMTQTVAVLLVAVFFLPGLLLYLALRPAETIEEQAERYIEAEAFAREIAADPRCTRCSRRVKADFMVCPHCTERLRSPCAECGRGVELSWAACAYCGMQTGRPARTGGVASQATSPARRNALRDGRFAAGQPGR